MYAFDKPLTAAVPVRPATAAGASWLPYFDQHLPLIVAAWLLGLLAMTLRFLGGLAYLDRLRHYRVRPLPAEWQRRLAVLGTRAGLRRSVALLESALVKAPLVAGHLRPVILLPLGTISGLSQAHLEAILAHELAHIVRRDYLMNLVQSITEILFFYHPGVWFVNACLRTERENCCDDMATTLCGSPLTLAQALTGLAELGHDRFAAPRLAVAAVGPDGSLLGRVRRLVQRRSAPTFSEGFMAAVVVLGGIVLLGVSSAFSMADPHFKSRHQETMAVSNWRADLLPGQLVVPPIAKIAPQGPVRDVAAGEAEQDEDKDKKRRRKKDNNRVVIIQDGARGRRETSTIVLERDKKGRLTEMVVDGQRIDSQALGKAQKRNKADDTQVIRLNVGRSTRSRGRADARIDSDLAGSILSDLDQDELRRSMRELTVDTEKMTRNLENLTLRSSAQVVDDERIRSQALRSAELGLRDAERRATNETEREKIREQLENIRQEREQVQEAIQAGREAAQAEREAVRAERDAARAERDARNRAADEKLIAELLKDGLIKDRQNFQLMMNAAELRVNGEKQSAAAYAKYRKLYEEGTGRALSPTGSVLLTYSGSNVNRVHSNGPNARASTFSAPPAPPLPPTPPLPPNSPRAPRPPRPPRTATFGSVDLGSQLRADGLIGQNDKSYQFQLNASGLTVNGKRQPEAVATRYRQLLDKDGRGQKFNMTVTVQE